MPGYAMLPSVIDPTSRLTFRLSDKEMTERNKWIIDSAEQGMSIEEIASEVGLGIQRVKQILGPPLKMKPEGPRRKFKTPRDAAMDDYYKNGMHPSCAKNDGYDMCSNCFGFGNIIESEYDATGWPYSWAMLGQEKFIEVSEPRR